MKGRALNAHLNDRLIGVLREEDDRWSFEYHPQWCSDPTAFDLSPALSRAKETIVDGSSKRPVQWYFDNLLPEEALRVALASEAKVSADDAFGLLEYFGAESAGSLVLSDPRTSLNQDRGLRPLPDAALSMRIQNLPRTPLTHDAPKRMSLAGAQHKLAVVMREGRLYEPMPGAISTHILKPNHNDPIYASSVINEYFIMRLAERMQLHVPPVHRRYVPEPVYLVDRFDRAIQDGGVARKHSIDSCQLLNKPRGFKFHGASVNTLTEIAAACRVRAPARLWLYRWLVFNILVGNADNHMKNISSLVSANGIEMAPAYDLLSTAVYTTRAMSEQPTWPNVDLALPLPGAKRFCDVTRASLLQAGKILGLEENTVERELDRLQNNIISSANSLLTEIERDNQKLAVSAKQYLAGELRLLRAITSIVIPEMVAQVASGLNEMPSPPTPVAAKQKRLSP